MQAPTTNRAIGPTLQHTTSGASAATAELQQRPQRATQHASNSLSSIGKRMYKSVGKLLQKAHAPKQGIKGKKQEPLDKLSDEQAAKNAAQHARRSAGRLQGTDGLRQSLLRPPADQASSSLEASSTFDHPDAAAIAAHKRADSTTSAEDELAAKNAARYARQAGSRLQGSDGMRQSMLRPPSNQASSSLEARTEFDDPLASAGPTARLSRSNAGHFDLQNGLLQRNAQPQNTIALSASGKADFSSFTPAGMGPLLNSVLADANQTYLTHHSQATEHEHLLLESTGHLLHLARQEGSLSLIRSSLEIPGVQAQEANSVRLERDAGKAQISLQGQRSDHVLPSKAHLAYVSGIYQTQDHQRLRIHNDRLYQFDADSDKWQAPEGTEDIAFNSLSIGGNGSIYAKSDDVLVDLSSELMPHMEVDNLRSFSVAPDSMAAILSAADDEAQSLLLVGMRPGVNGPKQHKTLEFEGGEAEATAVGLSQQRLFVADTLGRLFSAPRSDFAKDGPLQLKLESSQYLLADQPAGGHNRITGFISDDEGHLHALVQDRSASLHSYLLNEQSGKLESGWNLDDALVLDSVRGLSVPPAPPAQHRLNLDRGGLVGLSQGRILHWDATSQAWKDSAIKDIDHLQRAADSSAYVLKGGKLHKLEVLPSKRRVSFGSTSALAQKTSSTQATMGKEVKGLENRMISAFAMLNEKHFVVFDEQKKLTVQHAGRPAAELNFPGLEGDIKTLALDEKHNLYALNTAGKLFSLAKSSWQAKNPEAASLAPWQAVSTPDGKPVLAMHSNDDNFISVQVEGNQGPELLQRKAGEWKTFAPRPAEQSGFNQLFSRIKSTLDTKRIPGSGMQATVDVSLLGRSEIAKGNRASTKEFIRANIYKNTLETPRWMKNVGQHIQHRYQGREGLRSVYDAQSTIFKQLELIHETAETPPASGDDLKARIARLNLGPAGKQLLEQLESFREELEQHSYTALMHIGRSYGRFKNLRQRDGLLNLHGELSKQDARSKLGQKLTNLSEKLNFKSSGHDLVKELENALTQISPSADNPTGQLLQRLKDNGLKISHQKADIPLGQRRDSSDQQGLSKARLALDVVTLKNLGALLDQLELSNSAENIEAVQQKLSTLRDTNYAQNPVKQVTDMGFIEHGTLESAYDAIKSFLKSFKKPDHATSVNLRAASGSKDQDDLADKLKGVLRQLQHEDDEIGLVRNYGLNLSTPFISLAGKDSGPWPSAAVSGNRDYILNAERGDGGLTLYLISTAEGSASAGVGGGKDHWRSFFDEKDPAISADIGNNRKLTPNLRLDFDLTASATASQSTGVLFRVADEDIDNFVDDLFAGNVSPLDILRKATDHETTEARHFSFDISASAGGQMRAGINLTESGSNPLSAVARLGIAATASVNLLRYTDYSLEHNGEKTHLREGGKNRPRLFNAFNLNAQARAQLTTSHNNADHPTQPGGQAATTNLGGGASLSVDSKTRKRVKFSYQVAQPLTKENLDELSERLVKAFTGSLPKAQMLAPADSAAQRYSGKPVKQANAERLDWLNEIFASQPWQNDEQYSALRALKRATTQQTASSKHHSMLVSARMESNYTNLSRLDEQSVITNIIGSVKELSSVSNASRVADLIARDPKLKELLKGMQASDGTLARVRLEPKDSLLDAIDEGSRDGSMTQADLSTRLENRDDMRIRALTLFHTVTQAEHFTSPTPMLSYNSGASVSVTKVLGRIVFQYGEDQDTPLGYTFDGEQAKASDALKEAAGQLGQAGMLLKS